MHIQVAKRLQHTQEYYFSKKLREIDEMNRAGKNVINLGIGSPDLPPAQEVIDTLITYSKMANTHSYQSYKGIPELRDAIASWYLDKYQVNLDPNSEVLPLIGSKEGVMHICMTYLQEGDEALVPNPGYPTYSSAVRLSGATPIFYNLKEENDWLIDFEELEGQDLSKVKLMWVNYPHMPTGKKACEEFLNQLIAFGKKHNILICHDNPYSFILSEKPVSILQCPGAKEVAIELNSLSKSSNMAGWRIGMLIGNEKRIEEILRFKSNMDSGMFKPLQLAAVKALQLDENWYKKLNQVYANRKAWVHKILDLLGCSYAVDQVGLFVWARTNLDQYNSGYELSNYILENANVFITPGGIFGDNGDAYIRISLCANETVLEESFNRIKDIL